MRQAHSRQSRLSSGPLQSPHASSFQAWRRPGVKAPQPELYEPTNSVIALIEGVFSTTWFVVTLPFRLIFGTLALLGRMTGVVLGFALMVVGMALWAGPFFLIGIPLFLVGLVMTLRCLG